MTHDEKIRAVYSVLRTHLDGNTLLDSVLLFELRFLGQAHAKLPQYVERLCRFPPIAKNSMGVLTQLELALAGIPNVDLRDVPTKELDRRREQRLKRPGLDQTQTQSALFTNFVILMDTLYGQLDRKTQSAFKEEIEKGSPADIDKSLWQALRLWSADRPIHRVVSNRDQLRKLFNCVYQMLCIVQGPVATDRTLSELLERLKQRHPQAHAEAQFLL